MEALGKNSYSEKLVNIKLDTDPKELFMEDLINLLCDILQINRADKNVVKNLFRIALKNKIAGYNGMLDSYLDYYLVIIGDSLKSQFGVPDDITINHNYRHIPSKFRNIIKAIKDTHNIKPSEGIIDKDMDTMEARDVG